jgi:hypothetical protein
MHLILEADVILDVNAKLLSGKVILEVWLDVHRSCTIHC